MNLIVKRLLKKQWSKEFLLGWAAGFLEADGSFTVSKAIHGSFSISVGQVQLWPLEILHKYFKGGIYPVSKQADRNKGIKSKDAYVWELRGKEAVKLVKKLYLYMSPKRQKQIEKALIATGGNLKGGDAA